MKSLKLKTQNNGIYNSKIHEQHNIDNTRSLVDICSTLKPYCVHSSTISVFVSVFYSFLLYKYHFRIYEYTYCLGVYLHIKCNATVSSRLVFHQLSISPIKCYIVELS